MEQTSAAGNALQLINSSESASDDNLAQWTEVS